MENGFITPYDIANHLFWSKRFWYHGLPDITLEGENNKFGKLKFDFKDLVVEYSIYIHNRDLILDVASEAVHNFGEITQQIILERTE
jgi:hypothetical protein